MVHLIANFHGVASPYASAPIVLILNILIHALGQVERLTHHHITNVEEVMRPSLAVVGLKIAPSCLDGCIASCRLVRHVEGQLVVSYPRTSYVEEPGGITIIQLAIFVNIGHGHDACASPCKIEVAYRKLRLSNIQRLKYGPHAHCQLIYLQPALLAIIHHPEAHAVLHTAVEGRAPNVIASELPVYLHVLTEADVTLSRVVMLLAQEQLAERPPAYLDTLQKIYDALSRVVRILAQVGRPGEVRQQGEQGVAYPRGSVGGRMAFVAYTLVLGTQLLQCLCRCECICHIRSFSQR